MKKTDKTNIPASSRPTIPEYGISEGTEGMLSWELVDDWMINSRNYWISTTTPDNKPHATPVWGIWRQDVFYFGGGSNTRRSRNIRKNPYVVVHNDSGDKVVIIEGIAELIENQELFKELGKLYEEKYDMFHPPPFWRIKPQIVFAWDIDDYANSPTKWVIK